MTAPHQDARIETIIHDAVGFGVGAGVNALAGLAAGVLPVTDELTALATGVATSATESGIRHALAALGFSPRVDVTAGPGATVTVVLHDTEDPGAAPDTRPI